MSGEKIAISAIIRYLWKKKGLSAKASAKEINYVELSTTVGEN